MQNTDYIQSYLHQHIPLSRAMEVSVVEANPDGVVLHAPLAPNINHRESVFGGSASSVAILAAWTLVHFRLQSEGFNCRVLMQRNAMEYDEPILADFDAHCSLEKPQTWQRFIKVLKRKGRSRIIVQASLDCAGVRVGMLEGAFVAIRM